MTRAVLPFSLALVAAAGCRPRAEAPASRVPGGGEPPDVSATCAEPARLVDPARASAVWVIQAPGTSSGAEPPRTPRVLTGQYYSSGDFHIVILDTLGADGCRRTADSVAIPAVSRAEFLTNACGLAPGSADRRWVAVVPDTTAQVPRAAWRLGSDPPRIVPASADSVRCWRRYTG